MAKMLVLQGLPAAGKSTFAREFIKGKDNWVIINRDSLRRMMGDYWVLSREKLIKDSEDILIITALLHKYNVIVDDTNLNPKYISDLNVIAKKTGAEIEFKKFDIPLDELLKRDSNRENPVGEKVIRDFWKKYCENI